MLSTTQGYVNTTGNSGTVRSSSQPFRGQPHRSQTINRASKYDIVTTTVFVCQLIAPPRGCQALTVSTANKGAAPPIRFRARIACHTRRT